MSLLKWLTNTRFWKSIYRVPYPRDRRTRAQVILNSLALHLHPVRVPKRATRVTYTWGLGGLSVWTFILLTISGVWLMWYYIPTTQDAYWTVVALESEITFGSFMRNLHRWSAHAMVLAVLLHMTRVFYTGSYKPPREFNWVIGVVLFVVTALMSFSGYLLPWDQLGFWAINVGMRMGGATPVIGRQVNMLLLGGTEIGQSTLIRWYTLHVIFLPLTAILLMSIHFWRIRKDGNISEPIYEDDEEEEKKKAQQIAKARQRLGRHLPVQRTK